MAEVSLTTLAESNREQTRELFGAEYNTVPDTNDLAHKSRVATRVYQEYGAVAELPAALEAKMQAATAQRKRRKVTEEDQPSDPKLRQIVGTLAESSSAERTSQALTVRPRGNGAAPNANGPTPQRNTPSSALVRKDTVKQVKPEWHAPWKVFRVISGHMGWVRSVAMDPDNKFFVTGAADRTIKLWDLASGTLKLTLTGHISAVRGLAISPRHPYLFSCGEDKTVKCWDLETNKVIRHYHGHLSGVYALDLHPTLDVLATGGRDASVRIWDMRTRANIHVLSGHKGTCAAVKCQEADPQIISGSLDSTIRMYDLAAGKTMGVLTHHKKGVRALATHPKEFTFASGSSQSIKQWKCPEGAFMQNFEGHNAIVNTLSVNEDNVLFSGGDDGTTAFFDWKTGHKFQSVNSVAQPGSLDAEAGIMCSTFDRTGLRLITGESDKTIKIWKQDESATEDTNPLDWKPTLGRQKF